MYLCFSGSDNSLNSKQLTAKASLTAYKEGEWTECSDEYSDDYENVENKSADTSLNDGEVIIVPDPLPRKWSKKIFQLISSNSTKKNPSKTPISINLNPHKLSELFFDDEVVT